MSVVLNSREDPRQKKASEAERSLKKAAADTSRPAASDHEAPDNGLATPPEQPHRPWLVPGTGRL
jgi:hypothetical protein